MRDGSLAVEKPSGVDREHTGATGGDTSRSPSGVGDPANIMVVVLTAFGTRSPINYKSVNRAGDTSARDCSGEGDSSIGPELTRSIEGDNFYLIVRNIRASYAAAAQHKKKSSALGLRGHR
jgi:hypothetical protein